ncbi:MAG: hypothetical protein LBC61_00680 [Candidatus Peribacteria bacterium]|nr:hypothetical protein [Candidatus Peribacteria bacterium]
MQIIDNKDKLRKLLEECLKTSTLTPLLSGEGEREKCIVLDTETTSLDIISAELVGISIYLDDERIYYINRLHS